MHIRWFTRKVPRQEGNQIGKYLGNYVYEMGEPIIRMYDETVLQFFDNGVWVDVPHQSASEPQSNGDKNVG